MVTNQVDSIIDEIAEAEAGGLAPEEVANLRGAVEGAVELGMGMTYAVPEADKASWYPAWRLELDLEGVERGYPTKLPKDRLGYYLSKRRPIDGGRLFQLKMPERLAGERKFQCFILPNSCVWKSDTKSNLVDHMEMAHPRESLNYVKEIAQIRDAANAENVALQDIVASIVNTPDSKAAVPAEVREQYDASMEEVDITAGAEVISVSLAPVRCELCSWPTGNPRWITEQPTKQALRMHIMAKHKDDV